MEVKHGIWVGKFESSGNKELIRIIPNTDSLVNLSLGDMFTACLDVKNTYNLTGNSHIMKNTEWGVVSYLAESKYGRNGAEIMHNNNLDGNKGNYVSNILQSTTGNIYGIYDMNGKCFEYVAGIGKLSNANYDFTGIEQKYYDTYPNNYNESKKIKGDAIYETSTGNSNTSSWHQDHSVFVDSDNPVFQRGGCLSHE